jgi:hypothetical protein
VSWWNLSAACIVLVGMARRWGGPLILAAVGLALVVAGVVVWGQVSAVPACPDGYLCALVSDARHRVHPLRAEALWVVGGLCLVAAACWAARVSRLRPKRVVANAGA